MGKVQTTQEENKGELPHSSNGDSIDPTTQAIPFPPQVQSQTTASIHADPIPGGVDQHHTHMNSHLNNPTNSMPAVFFPPLVQGMSEATGAANIIYGTQPSGPSSHHLTHMTSRRTASIDSMPAVAFPPVAQSPEINAGLLDQHVRSGSVTQPNKIQTMTSGRDYGTKLGRGVIASGSVKAQQQQQQQQPRQTPVVLVQTVGNPWTSGLFDCLEHPTNALITTIAPCVTFGQISEILDNGSTSCATGAMLYVVLFLVVCHWNIGVRYRRRLRVAYNLAETPVTDRVAHVMFPLCALCQEFRELRNRGYDPFLGYNGIIAQLQHEQQQVGNNPPANQTMMR